MSPAGAACCKRHAACDASISHAFPPAYATPHLTSLSQPHHPCCRSPHPTMCSPCFSKAHESRLSPPNEPARHWGTSLQASPSWQASRTTTSATSDLQPTRLDRSAEDLCRLPAAALPVAILTSPPACEPFLFCHIRLPSRGRSCGASAPHHDLQSPHLLPLLTLAPSVRRCNPRRRRLFRPCATLKRQVLSPAIALLYISPPHPIEPACANWQ